jgi:hypothetical protein
MTPHTHLVWLGWWCGSGTGRRVIMMEQSLAVMEMR